MTDKKLNVIIGADISGFKKAMDDVDKSTKGAMDTVKNGFSKLTAPIKTATSGIGSFVAGVGKMAGASLIFKGVSAGVDMIKSSIDGAISRVDTLNQFPRVLQQMGYSAEEAQASTTKLSEGIKGLPTTLDGIVGSTQRLVTIFGDVGMATDTALALNNAFLASGASASDASRGLEQYTQMLSAGKVDMQSWRTLQETMPYALNETAKAFGFTGASAQNDFYAALKDGDITFDQFNSKLIELSQGTGGFAEVALDASKGIQTSWANIKTAIVTGVANVISSFDQWLNSKGFGGIAGVLDIIKASVQDAFRKVNELVPQALDGFEKLYNKVADSTAFNSLKTIVAAVKDKVAELWNKFSETGGLDTAKGILKDIGNAILDIDFVKLTQDIGKFLDKWSPLIAGIAGGLATFGLIQGAIAIYSGVMAIATGVTAAFGTVMAIVTSPITLIALAIGALIAVGVLLYKNWDTVKEYLSNVWNVIKATAETVFNAIAEFFTTIWENIKTIFTTVLDAISTAVQFGWEVIKGIIETVMLLIETVIRLAWEVIKAYIQTVLNIISAIVEAVWSVIGDTVTTVMNVIKNVIETVWNAIKSAIETVLNVISNVISTVWNAISNTTSTIFNAIKNTLTTIWNSIKSVIETVINAIKTIVTTVWNTISSTTTTVFNAIKNTASSVWNAIKSVIDTVVNGIKSVITTVWNAISTTTSNVFNGIKSTASSVWNGIKSAMVAPVEAAKNTIKGIIDAIKGFFSGISLRLPKIQMPALPHFSLSGSFSLMPPSVPKLSVSWYETGGIATSASIVGIGENGDEAILPLSNKKRMAPFASAVASMMNKDNDGHGKTGDTIITGNHFVVREEADINKIAQALHKLQKRETRLRGI